MGEKSFELDGIGTHWWFKLFDVSNGQKSEEVRKGIIACIAEFEENYSRFKETSFVAKLNDTKVLENFPQELYEMLMYAQEVEELTSGHFNIGVGKMLEEAGYDQHYSFQSRSKTTTIYDQKFSVFNSDYLALHDGVRIDLGGIGKGWLVDKVANVIRSFGVQYFWINAGGDIYATSNAGNPFEFLLENPFNTQEMIGKIMVMNESLACSSPNRRQWRDRSSGVIKHHLIDARGGEQVDAFASVFTHGSTCLAADTASTALFVSPQDLTESVARHFNVNYMIVMQDGHYVKSQNYQGILNI